MVSKDEREMEERILNAQISQTRIAEFYADYLESRRQSGALEAVFGYAGSFRSATEWDDSNVIGFNVILRKGPFVDGSNWLGYRGWEFALGLERHLLSKFQALLLAESNPIITRAAGDGWAGIFSIVDDIWGTIGSLQRGPA